MGDETCEKEKRKRNYYIIVFLFFVGEAPSVSSSQSVEGWNVEEKIKYKFK